MIFHISSSKEAASHETFKIIKTVVLAKRDAVLGLATGESLIRVYQLIVEDRLKCGTVYDQIQTINLDEYVTLPPNDPQSYYTFMSEHLFSPLGLALDRCHLPSGIAPDLEQECARYDKLIDSLPRDLQVLGIGQNSHIGFNEPGTSFSSRTQIVDLTKSTIIANARFFPSVDMVPKKGITMGIRDILQAKQIVLIAFGKQKAEAVKMMSEGEIGPSRPASALRTHPNVHIIIDNDAASLLDIESLKKSHQISFENSL